MANKNKKVAETATKTTEKKVVEVVENAKKEEGKAVEVVENAEKEGKKIIVSSAEEREKAMVEIAKLLEERKSYVVFQESVRVTKCDEKLQELRDAVYAYDEAEAFTRCKLQKTPKKIMQAAATYLVFKSCRLVDVKDKDENGKATGLVHKALAEGFYPIRPDRLHRVTKGGIGADSKWIGFINHIIKNAVFYTAVSMNAVDAKGNKIDAERFNSTFKIKDEYAEMKSATDNGYADDAIMQDVQTAIDYMIGGGYFATSEMVAYVKNCFIGKDRRSMTLKAARDTTIMLVMLDCCHKAMFPEDSFSVIYNMRKEKAN